MGTQLKCIPEPIFHYAVHFVSIRIYFKSFWELYIFIILLYMVRLSSSQ